MVLGDFSAFLTPFNDASILYGFNCSFKLSNETNGRNHPCSVFNGHDVNKNFVNNCFSNEASIPYLYVNSIEPNF